MQFLRVLPFFAVLLIVMFAGLMPEPVPQVFDQQDKLHHMLAFAAFAFTLRLAFPRCHLFWLITCSLSVALLIECGQGLLPHRTPSVGDMLANVLGVFLGGAYSLRLQVLDRI